MKHQVQDTDPGNDLRTCIFVRDMVPWRAFLIFVVRGTPTLLEFSSRLSIRYPEVDRIASSELSIGVQIPVCIIPGGN